MLWVVYRRRKKKDLIVKNNLRLDTINTIREIVEATDKTIQEKLNHLETMKEQGLFNTIGGSHQSHLVLNEAIAKLNI